MGENKPLKPVWNIQLTIPKSSNIIPTRKKINFLEQNPLGKDLIILLKKLTNNFYRLKSNRNTLFPMPKA